MIKHIVCHKLSDKTKAAQITQMLSGLVGKVPSLKRMEAGVDFMEKPRSYDFGLVAEFDDRAGLDAYDVHPEHEKVRAIIRQYSVGSVSVDFEL